MKYLSLYSGIEAATIAWEPLGWEPMAFAEIEPFPSAVLAERWPDVPNLGDVTTVDWEAWQRENGTPDVIIAGSPCQAFSVAGNRRSLEDARGNLTLFTAELVRFLRPGFFLWENVPGALSTKDNAFGCLLGELVGAGEPLVPSGKRWTNSGLVSGVEASACWRILDAQYFGVAQRRRRLFLVVCPRDGADPAAVLLECESLFGDPAPRREARQRVTGTLEGRTTAGGGGWGTDFLASGGMATDAEAGHLVMASGQTNAEIGDDICPALAQRQYKDPPIAFSCKDDGRDMGEISPPLRAMNHDASHANAGGQVAVAFTGDGVTADPISAHEGRTYSHEGTTFRMHNVVGMEPVAFDGYNQTAGEVAQSIRSDKSDGDHVGMVLEPVGFTTEQEPKWSEGLAPTLKQPSPSGGGQPACIGFYSTGGTHGVSAVEDGSPAIKVGSGCDIPSPPAVAFKPSHYTRGKDGAPQETSPPLVAHMGRGLGDQDPHVLAFTGDGVTADPISAHEGRTYSHEGTTFRMHNVVADERTATAFAENVRGEVRDCGDLSVALSTGGGKPGVGYPAVMTEEPTVLEVRGREDGRRLETRADGTANCLRQSNGGRDGMGVGAIHSGMAVRRLTPRECERLQGMPDDHTRIPWRGKPAEDCPDGPRYKAIGNSMAVPVIRWIGQRIQKEGEREEARGH